MCSFNFEYQFLNLISQLALFPVCINNCSMIMNTTWEIYQGASSSNFSSPIVEWTPLNSSFHDYFFGKYFSFIHFRLIVLTGRNSINLTAIQDLFLDNPQISFWRFELTYSFSNETSSTTLDFQTNEPPKNGSCSISPPGGTTITVFNIRCSDWMDSDDIKDFLFYSRRNFQ